jgi:hypothetical protein
VEVLQEAGLSTAQIEQLLANGGAREGTPRDLEAAA